MNNPVEKNVTNNQNMGRNIKESTTMISSSDVAAMANVAPQTLSKYVKEGDIVPKYQTTDKRYYFSEGQVEDIFLKKQTKDIHESTLLVVFNSCSDLVTMEEIKKLVDKRGELFCDSLYESSMRIKNTILTQKEQMDLFSSYVKTVIAKEMKKRCQDLKKKCIEQYHKRTDITDLDGVLRNFDFCVKNSHHNVQGLSEEDTQIYLEVAQPYLTDVYTLADEFGLYDLDELDRIIRSLDYRRCCQNLKNVIIKTKEVYLRTLCDRMLLEKYAVGYVSGLVLNVTDGERIYKLLEKSSSSEFKKIIVFGNENATPEEREILKFLGRKKVLEFEDINMFKTNK